MRQGLPGTRLRRYTPQDRDAAATLSVRDVAGTGGTGHPGMDARTGRLQRGVGMNRKQNVSHKNQGVKRIHLDN